MNFFISNAVHLANLMYLSSYLVTDILWLRILTIFAGFCLMPFYYFQVEPIWEGIAWNTVFVIINVVQAAILISNRRPVKLSHDEEKLYKMVFRSLKPQEYKKLLITAKWQTLESQKVVAKENVHFDEVMVLLEGEMDVQRKGDSIAVLKPGQFVGEMSFLTGEETSADVITKVETKVVSWSIESLEILMDKDPPIRSALQYSISEDLIGKLKRS